MMTDTAKPPVIALDACCVIEWLKGGVHHPTDADAVGRIISEAKEGNIEVVVSTAIIAEVLPRVNLERYKAFRLSLKNEWEVRALTISVARVVAYVRENLQLPPDPETGRPKTLKTLDAIHLGTAIDYRANFLCTMDDDLLALALDDRLVNLPKHRPVRGFRICKPREVARP